MNAKNKAALAERVRKAAEAALARQNYVSPIDVLTGIGGAGARSTAWKPPSRATCRASARR